MADPITQLIKDMQEQEEAKKLAMQAFSDDPFYDLRNRYVDDQGNIRYGKAATDVALTALTFNPYGRAYSLLKNIPKIGTGIKGLYQSGRRRLGEREARIQAAKREAQRKSQLTKGDGFTMGPSVTQKVVPYDPNMTTALAKQYVKRTAPKVVGTTYVGSQLINDNTPLADNMTESILPDTNFREEQGPPRPPSLMPQEIDIAGLPQRRERDLVAPVAPVAPKRDSERLGLMLYALGGALRGDKDFVSKAIQLREMKEGKKKEAEQKKAFDEFLVKAEKEGTLPQTAIDLARMVGAERGTSLILDSLKKDKQTAAQMNLEAYKKIAQTGTPEEIEIAERVLIGARTGKSIEQLRNETVANLSKSTNPITGEPLTTEEIRDRLKIFDDLIAPSTETPSVNNASDMILDGYTVSEVNR